MKNLVQTANRKFYNCAGYALNTFTWWTFDVPFLFHRYATPQENAQKIDFLKKYLLNSFDDIRTIECVEELQKDEYTIALRISGKYSNPDFHFLKRAQNGVWYEKRGSSECISRVPKEEVFGEWWCSHYSGKIALFAKKLPQAVA